MLFNYSVKTFFYGTVIVAQKGIRPFNVKRCSSKQALNDFLNHLKREKRMYISFV